MANLWKMLGLESKKPAFQEVDPYAQIRPLLRQRAETGFPELQNLWQQQWQQEIVPGIQEQYQAKRGLGPGSTPEIAALGRAGAGLMGQMSQQDLMGRLQALGMFAGTPTTGQFQPVTTPFQNLQNLIYPLIAGIAGGQMQAPWGQTGGGGISPAQQLAPSLYGGGTSSGPYGGMNMGSFMGGF